MVKAGKSTEESNEVQLPYGTMLYGTSYGTWSVCVRVCVCVSVCSGVCYSLAAASFVSM